MNPWKIEEQLMGNFYTNFTMKASDPVGILATLKASGRTSIVTPEQTGTVVVYDEASDTQDPDSIEESAQLLSSKHHCPVLAVLNHDDDIFAYWLFENGKKIDVYNSCPNYWDDSADADRGGNAAVLSTAMGASKAEPAVETILRSDDYTFEIERHAAMVKALGVSSWAIAAGFSYISDGELPVGLTADKLLRT